MRSEVSHMVSIRSGIWNETGMDYLCSNTNCNVKQDTGVKGVRRISYILVSLTSKVIRVSVITSPKINVINYFHCHQESYTSNIQFIKTSCIYLGTLFLKLLGNFEKDFKPCDQFQERRFE